MTMLNQPTAFADAAIGAMRPLPPVFAVDLIDRVTGRQRGIAAIPVTVMTRDRAEASAQLRRNHHMARGISRATPRTGDLQ